MRTEEHNLQKACITWFRLQFPNYIIFAIPNGAKRTLSKEDTKEEGTNRGVPDLMISWALCLILVVFFVEIEDRKAKIATLTCTGWKWLKKKKLQYRGYKVAVKFR